MAFNLNAYPGAVSAGMPIAAVARNPEHLDVFVTGTDGRIFSIFWDASGGWSHWFELAGTTAGIASPVAAIARDPDHLDLFVRGDRLELHSTAWNVDVGWGSWFPVPRFAAIPSSPIATVARNPNHLDVFVAGGDAVIYSTWWDGNEGWGNPFALDGVRASRHPTVGDPAPPTAVARTPDHIDLFVNGVAGEVHSRSWDASRGWRGWRLLPGVRAAPGTAITSVARKPDQIDLFITDFAGQVYSTWWDPTNDWHEWFPLPSFPAAGRSPITAIARDPDHLDLFVAGTDGYVYSTWWNASSDWAPWFRVPGLKTRLGTPIAAVARNPDHLDLFVTGTDGRIYSTWWDANGGWGNSFRLGSPIGHVFVLMLENRSFDHMLGFSRIAGTDAATGSPAVIDGLLGTESNSVDFNAVTQLVLRSPITAIASNLDHVDVFVTGSDGRIYGVRCDAGVWGNWFLLPGVTAFLNPPAAVARKPDHLDLFVVGDDGRIYSTWRDPNGDWGPWFPLPGVTTGVTSPITAVARTPDNLDLFVMANDARMYSIAWNASEGWGTWFPVPDLAPGLADPISVVARYPDHLDVFVTGGDYRIYTTWWDASSSWGRSFPLPGVTAGHAGGGLTAPPVAVARTPDHLDLFVTASDGGVYTTTWNASDSWDNEWFPLPGVTVAIGTPITAITRNPDYIDLFVTGSDGVIYSTSWNARTTWGSWFPLPYVIAKPASPVTAVARNPDHLDLFVTGEDGHLYSISWDVSTGWEYDWSGFGELTYTVSTGAADVIRPDPPHNFLGVLHQLCGPGVGYSPDRPYPISDPAAMPPGYVSAYATKGGVDAASAGDVMKCFGPDALPVLNALASEFVVCDRWFSSMPGPTHPNRFFMHAETSGTYDGNAGWDDLLDKVSLPTPTVFELIRESAMRYRVYAGDDFPLAAGLDINVDEVRDVDDLADDLKDPHFDAGFIHIEPAYDFLNEFEGGNSQHPSGSVAAGERLLKTVYEAIRSSPLWAESLLIVTWDEHGGFFDHVMPGPATATGEIGRDYKFPFDQLGPRVPAVIVSPFIRRNLIEHRIFDHTAIPATLRRVFGLPSVGGRDGITGGVNHLVGTVSRTDAPMTLPDPLGGEMPRARRSVRAAGVRDPTARLADDEDRNLTALLQSAMAQHLQITSVEEHAAIRARISHLETRADLFTYVSEVEQMVRARRSAAATDPFRGARDGCPSG